MKYTNNIYVNIQRNSSITKQLMYLNKMKKKY